MARRNLIVGIGISLILVFYGIEKSKESFGASPAPAAQVASPSASPQVASDPFRDAVNKAMSASQLAQAAKTYDEWAAVANAWNEAIALMKSVPNSNANHAIAQQKAVDYQKNAKYAEQNRETARSLLAIAPAESTSDRVFLGAGPTGYTLWQGKKDGCIYVVGLTDADLRRMNTDVWGLKEVIKQQTGAQCLFYE